MREAAERHFRCQLAGAIVTEKRLFLEVEDRIFTGAGQKVDECLCFTQEPA
jgi:hypothetical protein